MDPVFDSHMQNCWKLGIVSVGLKPRVEIPEGILQGFGEDLGY